MSYSPPASASTGGQRSRCQARLSAPTGMRRSTIRTFGSSAASAAGTRSFHELENSGHVAGAGVRERACHLMDVFADAGAGAEGRTIIDDDPHAAAAYHNPTISLRSTGWKDILSPFGRCSGLPRSASAPSRAEPSRMKIAVVGTGYVGLVLGACLAENGNDVTCIDKDAAKVRRLRRGAHAHLRARPRRDGPAQPRREAARVHDRPAACGPRRQHRVHRRRYAPARRWVGRSVARARCRARNRDVR